jgi:N-acetyl-gamma-glutamylphosphate reductase
MSDPNDKESTSPTAQTAVQRIMNRGKVEKIAVSRVYKDRSGDLFSSRTVDYTETGEDGIPRGGLTREEADVAVLQVAHDVEMDLIRRSLISNIIDQKGACKLRDLAEERYGSQIKKLAARING